MEIGSQERGGRLTFGLLLAALLMVGLWGVSFVGTKSLLLLGLNPSQIYIFRFGIAYLCLSALTLKDFHIASWRDELKFFFCGVTGGSLYFITENYAVDNTLVSNVGILVSTTPLVTAFVLKLFYPKEKIRTSIIVGSVIALVGVVFVLYNSNFELQISPLGDLLALSASVSWALYAVGLRWVQGRFPVFVMTRKIFFYGIITSLPLAFIGDFPKEVLSQTEFYVNIILLSLGCSMAAYVIWNHLVQVIGTMRASNFIYLSPLVTLLASSFILGEHLSVIGLIGCALILGGVIIGEKVGIKRHLKK